MTRDRVTELLEANNREVERRRAAEREVELQQRGLRMALFALTRIAEEHDAGRGDGLPEPCPALDATAMWLLAREALTTVMLAVGSGPGDVVAGVLRLLEIGAILDEDIDTSEIPECDDDWFSSAWLVQPLGEIDREVLTEVLADWVEVQLDLGNDEAVLRLHPVTAKLGLAHDLEAALHRRDKS